MVRSSINVGGFHPLLLSVSFQARVNVSVSFFPPSSPFLSPLFSSEKMDGQLVTAFLLWSNRNTNTYRPNNRTCQPPPPIGLVGKLA